MVNTMYKNEDKIRRYLNKLTKEDIENSVYLKEVDFNTSSLDDIMFYLNKLYGKILFVLQI